ncbi:achaete-scute homolog 5-like [Babylonia areolata]|uniref:achaete-scute homolog 5-like n=1 Tax=Babylonia areolata TaxID=304850 RepID=UPI003FD40FDD
MDAGRHDYVSCANYVDPHPVKMSSPTCEELGIPRNPGEGTGIRYPGVTRRIIHNPSLHLDGLRYSARMRMSLDLDPDPYGSLCILPLPSVLALHAAAEPSFIRKRNERERERVRCVNEGYALLKKHLPASSAEKRLSKVDTLRGAIAYIRHLEKILADNPPRRAKRDREDDDNDDDDNDNDNERWKTRTTAANSKENRSPGSSEEANGQRCASVSSQRSSVSSNSGGFDSEEEMTQYVKRQRIG